MTNLTHIQALRANNEGKIIMCCPVVACGQVVVWIPPLDDGTPAEPPRFPQYGTCTRHGVVRLEALDAVTKKRAA